MRILFVVSPVLKFAYVVDVLSKTRFTLSAQMQVDFAVFKFVERVYSSEFILFHADERRHIYLKY